jgi:formylglycine-generating enzyme required for sulfatase activity
VRQLQADTQSWLARHKSPSYLWSHERAREAASALEQLGKEVVLRSAEREFLGPVNPAAMLEELGRPEMPHRRHALIGERLDSLGDPRPGVGIDADGTPDIDWCAVPGGEVAIQVKRRLLGGTKPRRKQVGDFHIARYPITAGQYRAFVEAEDGWRDSQWWGDDLYRDPEGYSYDFGRYGNHPAVYVSWFDALAFCRWLSRRLDRDVRLLDEWEWLQAATGGDPARIFPWGADWDPKQETHRANTFESRLGSITAVGMYPAGASPTGALDMAGTVWEWCLNKHDKSDLTDSRSNDFDSRVLRGGSWYANLDDARSAFRFRLNPNYRVNDFGFRVLCLSPID